MQKRKKQLLGLLGLVLVVAMTVFAYNLPTSAAETTLPVKVQIVQEGEMPEVEVTSVNDITVGSSESADGVSVGTVIKRTINVKLEYAKATQLKLFVKNNGEISEAAAAAEMARVAGETEISLAGSTCADENIEFKLEKQQCEVTFELPGSLAGVNGVSFTTRAVATNDNAGASNQDIVAFTYRSAYLLNFGGEYVVNGDPIMEAKIGENVKSAYIVVYDQNGKKVEIPANDGKGHYKLDLSQMQGDSLKFALPLWEAGAKAGEYKVVLMAYDTDTMTEDGLVAMAVKDGIKYEVKNTDKPDDGNKDPNVPGGPNNPNNPDRPTEPTKPDDPDRPKVPDTGSIFSDLNISRADYIITGLIAFGVVTGFAFFLILRRNKR